MTKHVTKEEVEFLTGMIDRDFSSMEDQDRADEILRRVLDLVLLTPRCDQCVNWTDQGTSPRMGICSAVSSGNGDSFIVTQAHFGCVLWEANAK